MALLGTIVRLTPWGKKTPPSEKIFDNLALTSNSRRDFGRTVAGIPAEPGARRRFPAVCAHHHQTCCSMDLQRTPFRRRFGGSISVAKHVPSGSGRRCSDVPEYSCTGRKDACRRCNVRSGNAHQFTAERSEIADSAKGGFSSVPRYFGRVRCHIGCHIVLYCGVDGRVFETRDGAAIWCAVWAQVAHLRVFRTTRRGVR